MRSRRAELDARARVVFENERFAVYCLFASGVP
jgi:hypothetical protein